MSRLLLDDYLSWIGAAPLVTAEEIVLATRMEGLRKPVNDLSRGTTVADIVTTVAVTAAQVRDNEPSLAGDELPKVAEHF
ncbi:phosphate acyltransferase [Nonomuraea rubra]|uniref:Phosphate acetyl/butaryl transferase domain-containing protein n=1 Tax=Nonomuraea rubra TaxID=46180 RepID=A0A7X0NVP7_9ACTN|nr:phosphate acyltransferase [Nonomuraea rubra]MBB6550509.1 hypothetical protein [Nonomuraea rubra]